MLTRIRGEEPAAITNAYSKQAQVSFDGARACPNSLPVLISTRNGEADLPATLASLSLMEEPVIPVVVDNCSTDATSLVAKTFGADVIEAHDGNKMSAIQHGLHHITHTLGRDVLLLTDDDVLFPRTWSKIMREALSTGRISGDGRGVYGSSVYMHGESFLVDGLLSVARFGVDAVRLATRRHMLARGHNYGLALDKRGDILRAINQLDPNMFDGDAHAIQDAVLRTTGDVRGLYDPRSIVVTRGDRISSLREAWEHKKGGKLNSYRNQYGDFTTYKQSARHLNVSITGIDGSGKSTIARGAQRMLSLASSEFTSLEVDRDIHRISNGHAQLVPNAKFDRLAERIDAANSVTRLSSRARFAQAKAQIAKTPVATLGEKPDMVVNIRDPLVDSYIFLGNRLPQSLTGFSLNSLKRLCHAEWPDLLIWLDTPPDLALCRIADAVEGRRALVPQKHENIDSLAKMVRAYTAAFETISKSSATRVVRIHTDRPMQEVSEQVSDILGASTALR